MPQKMTKEQKENWERAKELDEDLKKSALKECNTPVNCEACGEYLGYASKDLYFEDFQIVCVSCGEKNG